MIVIIVFLSLIIVLAIGLELLKQYLTSEEDEKESSYKPEKCPTCGKTNITRDDSYGGLG